MPVRVRKAPLSRCVAIIRRQGLAPPTDQAVAKIIEGDLDFTLKLNRFYRLQSDDLDTAEREELLDLVAQYFAQRSWPLNGESAEDATAFVTKLVAGAKAAGWA